MWTRSTTSLTASSRASSGPCDVGPISGLCRSKRSNLPLSMCYGGKVWRLRLSFLVPVLSRCGEGFLFQVWVILSCLTLGFGQCGIVVCRATMYIPTILRNGINVNRTLRSNECQVFSVVKTLREGEGGWKGEGDVRSTFHQASCTKCKQLNKVFSKRNTRI